MRKVSVIFSHYQTFRWTAIAVHFLKKYQWPIPWELIICDNSPGHPSIRAITETRLGEGVKVIQGESDFPSHGRGNELAMHHATGSHFFFSESDAFPIRDNFANEYIKAVGEGYDLIGPEIPQGSGPYIHPAGSLYNRTIFDSMHHWQEGVKDWLYAPDAAIELGTSDKGFHVIIHKDEFERRNPSDALRQRTKLWQRSENMQEMRGFVHGDTFSNYMLRTGINNWDPPQDTSVVFNKIGYEAGQVAAYYAQSHGFRCLKAPTDLQWMRGHHGGQAAFSDVFGGFRHCWCGTSSFSPAIAPDVREYKMTQMNGFFAELPKDLQTFIIDLEEGRQ